MSVKTVFNRLYARYSKAAVAARLGPAYQSIDRWVQQNRMPRTEFDGTTTYSLDIEEMLKEAGLKHEGTVVSLLGFEPEPIKIERHNRLKDAEGK